jgi:two-component system response regulator
LNVPKRIPILLVEDNEADARLVQIALERCRPCLLLHVVKDGESAISFLHQGPGFENAPRPKLIVLDLNLPGMDGRKVLQRIKHDLDLRTIPVVVLSSSPSAEDVSYCYHNHANGYLRKPTDFSSFATMMARMTNFWFDAVTPAN